MTTNDDALINAQLRRCLHELEQNWCDLVNTLSNLVDIEPDVDDFDPATSIAHELVTLRNQLTVELEQTAALRTAVDGLDRVREVADALFEHLTSDEPEETWSQERAGELLEDLAVALHDTDRPAESRRVLMRLAGNTTKDMSRLVRANLTGTSTQEMTVDEATAAMSATVAKLQPPTAVEPASIDDARQQMIHDLHRALYGASWARPVPPAQIWFELLHAVRELATASGVTTAHAIRDFVDTLPNAASDQDAQFAAIDFTRSQSAI